MESALSIFDWLTRRSLRHIQKQKQQEEVISSSMDKSTFADKNKFKKVTINSFLLQTMVGGGGVIVLKLYLKMRRVQEIRWILYADWEYYLNLLILLL